MISVITVTMNFTLEYWSKKCVIILEGCSATWIITVQYITKPSKAYNDFSHREWIMLFTLDPNNDTFLLKN